MDKYEKTSASAVQTLKKIITALRLLLISEMITLGSESG